MEIAKHGMLDKYKLENIDLLFTNSCATTEDSLTLNARVSDSFNNSGIK